MTVLRSLLRITSRKKRWKGRTALPANCVQHFATSFTRFLNGQRKSRQAFVKERSLFPALTVDLKLILGQRTHLRKVSKNAYASIMISNANAKSIRTPANAVESTVK